MLFSVNDEKNSAWLRAGEQLLQKKGRGRLIHVSDFINEEDGQIVLQDAAGIVVWDARKIIYPGGGKTGDGWWDCDQLLTQTKEAIDIFNMAHPDCQALFVFDNSSAHGYLPPDALKAFEMNKSDSGKQRCQQDTVIPQSNPDPTRQGLIQHMTNDAGQPKGLESILKECGFDTNGLKARCSPVCPIESTGCCMARLLSQQEDFDIKNQLLLLQKLVMEAGHLCIFLLKFHCELNPIEMVSWSIIHVIWSQTILFYYLQYWGWCKYRYQEITKESFAHMKAVAIQYLDACSMEVIRHFINWS
jgi:hypothetical protein